MTHKCPSEYLIKTFWCDVQIWQRVGQGLQRIQWCHDYQIHGQLVHGGLLQNFPWTFCVAIKGHHTRNGQEFWNFVNQKPISFLCAILITESYFTKVDVGYLKGHVLPDLHNEDTRTYITGSQSIYINIIHLTREWPYGKYVSVGHAWQALHQSVQLCKLCIFPVRI